MKFPHVLFSLFLLVAACTTSFQKRKILVIGDSNGAAAKGWVFQFQQIRKGGPLVNTAVGGNTIGFDGMQQSRLNTLNQLVVYLRQGYAEMGAVEEVIIALGTNDCKYEYRDATANRHKNYRDLLNEIKQFFTERGQALPRIVLLSPPPVGPNDQVSDEFRDAAVCVAEMAEFIGGIAAKEGYCYANLLVEPGESLLANSTDGVHFDALGYEKIARKLIQDCY
ncbi:MAG: SGNH/GDSL hydrolase family protein [Bacteroidota bacterium]